MSSLVPRVNPRPVALLLRDDQSARSGHVPCHVQVTVSRSGSCGFGSHWTVDWRVRDAHCSRARSSSSAMRCPASETSSCRGEGQVDRDVEVPDVSRSEWASALSWQLPGSRAPDLPKEAVDWPSARNTSMPEQTR